MGLSKTAIQAVHKVVIILSAPFNYYFIMIIRIYKEALLFCYLKDVNQQNI